MITFSDKLDLKNRFTSPPINNLQMEIRSYTLLFYATVYYPQCGFYFNSEPKISEPYSG